jgi:dTDP-4-dehydrorhamnose 3,5-epimerase
LSTTVAAYIAFLFVISYTQHMQPPLTHKDIEGKYHKKLFIQDYAKKPVIEGVKIIEIKNFVGEDGDFSELMRVHEGGESEQFPGFYIRQMSRSKVLPKAIKAWHIHFAQEDIWHILPEDRLLVGLWDVRKYSSTNGLTMRLALGGGKGHLVYIPRGVAHGGANHGHKPATILYFVNSLFNIDNPDEIRLPWNELGAEFWDLPKG